MKLTPKYLLCLACLSLFFLNTHAQVQDSTYTQERDSCHIPILHTSKKISKPEVVWKVTYERIDSTTFLLHLTFKTSDKWAIYSINKDTLDLGLSFNLDIKEPSLCSFIDEVKAIEDFKNFNESFGTEIAYFLAKGEFIQKIKTTKDKCLIEISASYKLFQESSSGGTVIPDIRDFSIILE